MVAKWPDGMVHKLENVTVGYWKSLQSDNGDAKRSTTKWQDRHPIIGSELVIKRRMDVHELYSLYEQNAQILQVLSDGFLGSAGQRAE